MILYGWNHYLLKKISLLELGIAGQESATSHIEYRQKYFHLFFIPVFPIGRFWAVRQGTTLYQPAESLLPILRNHKVETRNWIWAWSGILLVLAIMLIANLSEKWTSQRNAQLKKATDAELNTYFANKGNTQPRVDKILNMRYLTDSCFFNLKSEESEIDTSLGGMISLMIALESNQKGELNGYSLENTAVASLMHEKKYFENTLDQDVEDALMNHQWKGYAYDTSAVFRRLRKFDELKYLLVLTEYNRSEPVVTDEGYSTGVSLVRGALFNLENKMAEAEFKVMGMNSDTVSHFTWARQGESTQVSNEEWRRILSNDLDANARKKAYEYIFRKTEKGVRAEGKSLATR